MLTTPDTPRQAATDSGSIERFIGLRDSGDWAEAVAEAALILTQQPQMPYLWIEQGRLLRRLGRLEPAIACFKNAYQVAPDCAIAVLLIGHCVLEQKQWHDRHDQDGISEPARSTRGFCDSFDFAAIASLDNRDLMVEMSDLATDLRLMGRFPEAVLCLELMTRLLPDYINGHFFLGYALLALRRFAPARAALLEWTERQRLKQGLDCVIWRGEDLTGKTVYVFEGAGYGDSFMFLRYLPILRARCARVYFQLRPNLRRLVGALPDIDILDAPPSHFDFMTSLFLLPHVIGLDADSVPCPPPYLHANPSDVAAWRTRLPPGRFRVGLFWQGNQGAETEGRSVPLAALAPITAVPGVTLISLQVHYGADQLASLPAGVQIHRLGEDFDAGADAFVDTAAVMASLDLVISSDTSVAHLAGAMGVPVWLMMKQAPDWRWMQPAEERQDCPWYPSMRVFRQQQPGDWLTVSQRVAAALAERLRELDGDA